MVAIATPLVFAPLAGAIIAGATIAFAKSGLWLKGWQDYEKREQAGRAAVAEFADDPYAAGDDELIDELADDVEDEVDDDDGITDEWDTALEDELADEPVEDSERDAIVAGVG
jgi:hypothetical protein